MDNWTGDGTPYFCRMATMTSVLLLRPQHPNFVLYEDVVYVNQDGTIMNYYETEAFEENCRNAKECTTAALSIPISSPSPATR